MHKHPTPVLRWGRIILVAAVAFVLIVGCAVNFFYPGPGDRTIFNPVPSPTTLATPSPESVHSFIPTATPFPKSTPESAGKAAIRLRVVGDLMCHEANYQAAHEGDALYDFNPFFKTITPALQAADLTIGNFETTVGDPPYSGYPAFRSPVSYLDALKEAGFDVLTFANNHTLDKGLNGVRTTLAAMKEADIATTGAYTDEESAKELLLMDVQGVNIAILAYTEFCNVISDAEYALNYLEKNAITEDIRVAREQGADIVCAMVHWGVEYSRNASDHQRAWAEHFSAAGADLVLGSHPHVVQTAEWIETLSPDGLVHDTFIAYSMGNFISNQRDKYRDAGVIFDFKIEKDLETGECSVVQVHYIPTYVHKYTQDDRFSYAVLPAGIYTANPLTEAYLTLPELPLTRVREVWSEEQEMFRDSGATVLME